MEGECPHCGTHQTFVTPEPESPFANASPPEPVDITQQDVSQAPEVATVDATGNANVPSPAPSEPVANHSAPSAPIKTESESPSDVVTGSPEVPPSIPPATAEVPAPVESIPDPNPNPLPALAPPLQPLPQVAIAPSEPAPDFPNTAVRSPSEEAPSISAPVPEPTAEASLPPVAPSSPELPPVPRQEIPPVPSSPEPAEPPAAIHESGPEPFSAVKPTSTPSTPPPLPQAPSTPEVPAYLLNLYGEQKPSKQKKDTRKEETPKVKKSSPGKRKHSPIVDILAVSLIAVLLIGVGYLAWTKFSPGESDTPSAKANVPALTQASEGKTAGQAK